MARRPLVNSIIASVLFGVFLFAMVANTWRRVEKNTERFGELNNRSEREWEQKRTRLLTSTSVRTDTVKSEEQASVPQPQSDPYRLDPQVVAKQYDIQPAPCSAFTRKPFLLLIVFARPDGFTLRQAIRKTWAGLANPVCGVRVLFMFGRVTKPKLQISLRQEADKYGDVIQSNQFEDNYRSAALKAIHLLQWGATFCPESTYTAKLDDDNWLNLPRYYKFLQRHQREDFVFGWIMRNGSRVLRNPSDGSYVPREEFPNDRYPEYLSGVLYAFKTKFVPKVVHLAKRPASGSITFNDDVYMCGIVTDAAGLVRKAVPKYAWDHRVRDTACPKRDKMCIHYSDVSDFYRLWNDPCYRYEELC